MFSPPNICLTPLYVYVMFIIIITASAKTGTKKTSLHSFQLWSPKLNSTFLNVQFRIPNRTNVYKNHLFLLGTPRSCSSIDSQFLHGGVRNILVISRFGWVHAFPNLITIDCHSEILREGGEREGDREGEGEERLVREPHLIDP